jgi:hypothetical protein
MSGNPNTRGVGHVVRMISARQPRLLNVYVSDSIELVFRLGVAKETCIFLFLLI